jgi:hypothetical protein
MHSANLAAPGGKALWQLPLAVNLATGSYTLRVKDVPTGTSATRKIELR